MRTVPLRERKYDIVFIVFFLINAYVHHVHRRSRDSWSSPTRQNFDYPVWPPPPLVDLVHWYGNNYDPLLMARPPFWRMTIWIDVIFFGPFYAFAIYAFIRGRNWIRVPALVWSGTMMANVLIILMDERYGVTPAPNFWFVLALNLPWLLFPFAVIWRMRRDTPFTGPTDVRDGGPAPGGDQPPPARPPAAAAA